VSRAKHGWRHHACGGFSTAPRRWRHVMFLRHFYRFRYIARRERQATRISAAGGGSRATGTPGLPGSASLYTTAFADLGSVCGRDGRIGPFFRDRVAFGRHPETGKAPKGSAGGKFVVNSQHTLAVRHRFFRLAGTNRSMECPLHKVLFCAATALSRCKCCECRKKIMATPMQPGRAASTSVEAPWIW